MSDSDSYSEAIKEAFAIAPSGVVIYHTIEVRQDGVQDPIFMVRSRKPLVAYDELGVQRTFEPTGFEFTLPPKSEEGFTSLNIAIDNVGRRPSDFIDMAKSTVQEVKVIYRPYLSTDLTVPHMNPPLVLFLKDINMTPMQVTGRATFMDVVNKKFPLELYTRERFPALG